MKEERFVGVISDTHGLLRPEAVDAMRGAEQIVHAGDVGRGDILETLEKLAPVTAVRGNVDHAGRPATLPDTAVLEWNGATIYVLHDLDQLDLIPAAAGFGAVVFGHSHHPLVDARDGVLFLNPGSAGPRRFRLPVTVARLMRRENGLHAEIVPLTLPPGR